MMIHGHYSKNAMQNPNLKATFAKWNGSAYVNWTRDRWTAVVIVK